MNAHARDPFTADTAEQLLDGVPGAARRARRLADRLALASAPAFPGELAGEDAAVAAYRAMAGAHPVPTPGRSLMIKSAVLAKLLTLKAAVVAAVVLTAGGVAVAANTGVLPNPLTPGHPGQSSGAPGGGPNATPSPSLIGLCTAYLAGAGADHGKALDSPAFNALVVAAGGKANVDAFCAGLGVSAAASEPGSDGPSEHPSEALSTLPSATAHPTDGAGHPTGEPSHPTSSTSHPGS